MNVSFWVGCLCDPASPAVIRGSPCFVRVVELHLPEDFKCVGTRVLLVNNAVKAHDERLHARNPIFRRRSGKSKSSDHRASDDEAHLAKRSSRALSFQNLEVVTVIGLALVCVALLQSLGNPLGNGSPQATVGVIPDKPVVFAWSADDSLGILIYFGIVVLLQGVFVLRIHVSPTYLDGIQFIGTDAPVEDLLTADLGIEQPIVAFLDQWDRQRPAVIANQNRRAASLLRV